MSMYFALRMGDICRVGVLEKRLEEKVQENRELQEQLQKGRETLQVALTAKEDMQRRVQQSQRSVAETRKISIEDLNELEQVKLLLSISVIFLSSAFLTV